MEIIIEFICTHAHQAHWIIFSLLILAGLNIPISEDVLLIIGGAIASTCIPHEVYHLFAWIFLGCVISGWEAYWLGRLLGPKLYNIKWFNRIITPQRIANLHHYYEKFGVLTFIVGRFIPGGVRNALFITTGLGQMPFLKFILRDFLACCISATTLFAVGYYFGENYRSILKWFTVYDKFILGSIFIILSIIIFCLWRKKATESPVG